MEPDKVAPYFGTVEKPECHMLYNVTTMATTWPNSGDERYPPAEKTDGYRVCASEGIYIPQLLKVP